MSPLMLLLMLPLKHLMVSHFFDIGYSNFRDPNHPRRWFWGVVWLTLEIGLTIYLLPNVKSWYIHNLPAIEFVVLIAGAYFERHAMIGSELRTHFFWLLMTLGVYITAIFIIP